MIGGGGLGRLPRPPSAATSDARLSHGRVRSRSWNTWGIPPLEPCIPDKPREESYPINRKGLCGPLISVNRFHANGMLLLACENALSTPDASPRIVGVRLGLHLDGDGPRRTPPSATSAVITFPTVERRREVRRCKQARHVELADGSERFAAATAARTRKVPDIARTLGPATYIQ
jgi:hypothetical protein